MRCIQPFPNFKHISGHTSRAAAMGRPATLTQQERDELYEHGQHNLKLDGTAVRQGTWKQGFQFSSGKWIEFKVAQQARTSSLESIVERCSINALKL